MDETDVWLSPFASKTAGRNVQVANDFVSFPESTIAMRKYFLANDLSEGHNHGLFSNLLSDVQTRVEKQLVDLSLASRVVWNTVRDTKHPLI